MYFGVYCILFLFVFFSLYHSLMNKVAQLMVTGGYTNCRLVSHRVTASALRDGNNSQVHNCVCRYQTSLQVTCSPPRLMFMTFLLSETTYFVSSGTKPCVNVLKRTRPPNRQHLSYDFCLEVEREDDQNCSLLYSVLTQLE